MKCEAIEALMTLMGGWGALAKLMEQRGVWHRYVHKVGLSQSYSRPQNFEGPAWEVRWRIACYDCLFPDSQHT